MAATNKLYHRKKHAANVTQINALNENKNLAKESKLLLLNFCQFIFFICICEYFFSFSSLSLSQRWSNSKLKLKLRRVQKY